MALTASGSWCVVYHIETPWMDMETRFNTLILYFHWRGSQHSLLTSLYPMLPLISLPLPLHSRLLWCPCPGSGLPDAGVPWVCGGGGALPELPGGHRISRPNRGSAGVSSKPLRQWDWPPPAEPCSPFPSLALGVLPSPLHTPLPCILSLIPHCQSTGPGPPHCRHPAGVPLPRPACGSSPWHRRISPERRVLRGAPGPVDAIGGTQTVPDILWGFSWGSTYSCCYTLFIFLFPSSSADFVQALHPCGVSSSSAQGHKWLQ